MLKASQHHATFVILAKSGFIASIGLRPPPNSLLTVVGSNHDHSRYNYSLFKVKPGHYSIKEYHFHIYFRRNFEAEG